MRDDSETTTVEVRLRGTREEVQRAMEDFRRKAGVEVLLGRTDGGWPLPLTRLVGEDVVARFARRGARSHRLESIYGGDMTPHVHLGDEIYLLETEPFQDLIGEVAQRLTTEFAGRVNYEQIIDLMSTLAIDTVPLPQGPGR